jgi:hypothetical protein
VGRKVDLDDLVDASAVAERMGVHRQLVHDWQRRYADFPAPVLKLPKATIWLWPEVQAWARKTGRLGKHW